jgi:hypothetical protein
VKHEELLIPGSEVDLALILGSQIYAFEQYIDGPSRALQSLNTADVASPNVAFRVMCQLLQISNPVSHCYHAVA